MHPVKSILFLLYLIFMQAALVNIVFAQNPAASTSRSKSTGAVRPELTQPLTPETRQVLPASNSASKPAVFSYQLKYNDGSSMKRTFSVLGNIAVKKNGTAKANALNARVQVLNQNTSDQKTAGGIKHCVSKTASLSAANIEQFGTVFASSDMLSNIYPGALYHMDDYYRGNFNAINEGRNGMTITSDNPNLNGPAFVNVGNPGSATLREAVRKLFSRQPGYGGAIGYNGFAYNIYKVESAAEMDFAVNAGGHYLMVAASNSFASSEREFHKYLVIDGIKNMFTLMATPGITNTGETSGTMQARALQGQGLLADPSRLTNDLVYINKVSYGARVLAVVELNTSSKALADKFSGGAEFLVGGGSMALSAAMKEYKMNMKISYYSVGGDAAYATTVNSFEEMESNIRNLFSNTDFNNARPISYSLANINGDQVSLNTATDQFTTQSCSFDSDTRVDININAVELIDRDATDVEFYGQVWAEIIDNKGRLIAPLDGRDRLFDVKQDQHLNLPDFKLGASGTPSYTPNSTVSFIVPREDYPGARLVIYYWMMEYDNIGGDDFLSMRDGRTRKYKRNNMDYYTSEYQFIGGEQAQDFQGAFVDRDGQSGIWIKTRALCRPDTNGK